MKKTIIIIAALAVSLSSKAQSLDDGIKMYKYERYTSAEKILQPQAAGNAMANYYYGLSQLGLGQVNEAKATFSKFPDDPANMSGLARIAFINKDVAGANAIVQKIADKATKKDKGPLRYAADAITYSTGGDYQKAIDWYKQVLEKNDDPDVHIALGDAYQKIQGGGGEAMNNYEHVIEKDPKNSLAFSRIGSLWYDARNYNSALDNYAKAKDADPTNPIPYKKLADAYERVGKYDQALDNIKKYIDMSDKSTDDMMEYSDILFLSGHYPEAVQVTQQLINQGSTDPRLYGKLGFSQLETGDSVDALNNARKFIQSGKNVLPSDYLEYAKIFMKLGQGDSADHYYNVAISADTSSNKSDIYRQIAEGFKASKDYKKSAYWYDKLVTTYPATQPLDYFWSVVMHYYSKEYDQSGKMAAAFEAKYPDQPSATYWRGRAAAAIDSEATEGTAAPFFKSWLDKVGPNYDKKGDLKIANEYMLLYYYKKKDKENETIYENNLKAIDPNDNMLTQIQELQKQEEKKPATKAPAKGKK